MKRLFMIAGLAALVALPATAQDADPAVVGDAALRLQLVEGASAAPDCGGLLTGQTQCVTAPLSDIGRIGELYEAAFLGDGWTHAGGGDNVVIFQYARPDGACDFLEMVAFYDPALTEEMMATAPGYLGFTLNTDGVCLTAPIEIPSAQ